MKFRGRMLDVLSIKKFYNVLTTLGKLSKQCVLRLTKEKVYFIVKEAVNSDGFPSVWCDLNPDHFFTDYNLQGVTPTDNQIYMELEPDQLARNLHVLKGGGTATAKSLKVKLTRKHDSPCLSFEIEGSVSGNDANVGGDALCRLCTHDFPVTLIPRKQWQDYKEPTVGVVDVSLYLPELKSLRHISEKYKNLGNHVTLTANREGELKMALDNERVNLSTFFKNLEAPKLTNLAGNVSSQEDSISASVLIDLKKFSQFLSADVTFKKALANFIHDQSVHLFLLEDELCIQYIIPSVVA